MVCLVCGETNILALISLKMSLLAYTVFVSLYNSCLRCFEITDNTQEEHRCIIFYWSCGVRLFTTVSKFLPKYYILFEVGFLGFLPPSPRANYVEKVPAHLSVCLSYTLMALFSARKSRMLVTVLYPCKMFHGLWIHKRKLMLPAQPSYSHFEDISLVLQKHHVCPVRALSAFCYWAWPEVSITVRNWGGKGGPSMWHGIVKE